MFVGLDLTIIKLFSRVIFKVILGIFIIILLDIWYCINKVRVKRRIIVDMWIIYIKKIYGV